MRSTAFRQYIGQFATKGLKIGNYTFKSDGEYSNSNLTLYEYNLSSSDQGHVDSNNGGYLEGVHNFNLNADGSGLDVNLQIFTRNHSSSSAIAETLGHESQLHGYKMKYLLKALKEGGIKGFEAAEKKYDSGKSGKKDHDALKNDDMNHEGVRKYKEYEEEREY